MSIFARLDILKVQLDRFRPIPAAVLANLHEDMVLRWTYHSNAIEGNTLTLQETKVVLEGVTVGGKTLREHFEAINHRDAIGYVETLLRDGERLTAHSLRSIHALILRNIDDVNAGAWRNYNVTIAGARHVPPDAHLVPGLMDEFMSWRTAEENVLHPVEFAARSHSELVRIHPFMDGNGRTARLLMNLDLMRAGFPPVILPVERRLEYYTALDTAHFENDPAPFVSLIAAMAERAFEPYWHVLGVIPE